jgi:hypothetical protein
MAHPEHDRSAIRESEGSATITEIDSSFLIPTRPRQAPVYLYQILQLRCCLRAWGSTGCHGQSRYRLQSDQRQKLNYLSSPRNFGFVLQTGRPGAARIGGDQGKILLFSARRFGSHKPPRATAIGVNERQRLQRLAQLSFNEPTMRMGKFGFVLRNRSEPKAEATAQAAYKERASTRISSNRRSGRLPRIVDV